MRSLPNIDPLTELILLEEEIEQQKIKACEEQQSQANTHGHYTISKTNMILLREN